MAAHLLWGQGGGGSNPPIPTSFAGSGLVAKARVSGTRQPGFESLLPDQIIAGEWNGQPREPHKLEDNGFDSRARYQVCPHRLAARMLGSQPSDAGSSPAGGTGAWRSWSPRGTVNAENAGSSPVVPAKFYGLFVYR